MLQANCAQLNGSKYEQPDALPKSEIHIESQSVETSLAQMAELITVLERRLTPIITPVGSGVGTDKGCSPIPSLSWMGYKLHSYSDQIHSYCDRISALLDSLALD